MTIKKSSPENGWVMLTNFSTNKAWTAGTRIELKKSGYWALSPQ
jgi:hypothetical protein